MVHRIRDLGGAVLAGQTTASEFGGVNLTRTLLHGTTRNPWQLDRTPGGSSGGSAAAVAGGLLTLATGGDGGGSIRIPAGFCGLVGLKGTFGRIPRSPEATYGNLTVTIGCLSRSVRDTARWFDVANGHDARDPLSLPRVEGLGGRRSARSPTAFAACASAVVADWGGAAVSPAMWDAPRAAAERPDRRRRARARRRHRRRPAPDGRGLVDQRDDRHRRRARRRLAGLRRRPDAGDPQRPGRRPRASTPPRPGRASSSGGWRSTRRWRGSSIPSTASTSSITASNPDVAFAADGPLPSHVRRRRGRRRQQRPADVPRQPPRQPGHLHPRRRARRPARSACRSSAATSPSRCCWSWPTSSNATGPGR